MTDADTSTAADASTSTAAVKAASSNTTTITRFTEAVPLSLSSVAHNALPLEDGVLDGLKTILQHTLWSSLSYARAAFGRNYSPVDLMTSPLAWTPREFTSLDPEDAIPASLKRKHGFHHSYERTAVVYLRPAMADTNNTNTNTNTNTKNKTDSESSEDNSKSGSGSSSTVQQKVEHLPDDNWTDEPGALAKITLLYASTGEMTPEELNVATFEGEDDTNGKKKKKKNGKKKKRSADEISSSNGEENNNNNKADAAGGGGGDDNNNNNHDGDSPPPPPKHVIMYRATIEYRSLPATGNDAAVRAEELSMLSFGGSLVDDDVKYGALASLYDDHAKYVLEIFGVRGKKYRLDLMDATLSDGTVPTLPSRSSALGGSASAASVDDGGIRRTGVQRGGGTPIPHDPFVKTLCVTVTDHEPTGWLDDEAAATEEEDKNSSNSSSNNNPNFALTKMRLSLEGDLRITHLLNATDLPPPNFFPDQIQKTFFHLRSQSLPEEMQEVVVGMPSGHRLLLDPTEAGKVYIHGRYVTTWGEDPRIGGAMNCTVLFGMDLHSIPYWHGRIVDFDRLMIAYATLWAEILTDARLVSKNIGGRLLSRMITGNDPFLEVEEDDDEEMDEEDSDDSDSDDDDEETATRANTNNINMSCLESQVMSSSRCDPVGISAKALATKFQNEYGREGYPCLAHEMDWVKDRLPGRVPVAVPQRLIDVLRRGGYFDIKRTSEEVWFSKSRPASEGTGEEILLKRTCQLLEEAKCNDVKPPSIVFGTIDIDDPVQKKGLVRINRVLRQYHVNEAFLTMDLKQIRAGDSMIMIQTEEEEEEEEDEEKTDESKKKRTEELALMLGLHIAREHPDGNVLIRYILQHMVKS